MSSGLGAGSAWNEHVVEITTSGPETSVFATTNVRNRLINFILLL